PPVLGIGSCVDNSRILIVPDLETAARLCNAVAPEHLEICTDDPFALLPLIHNAGSVFLGRYCPEPLGDYLAGPNHTLPTSGTARFSSPLGVDDFCKRSSYLYYTKDALNRVGADVRRFALSEGLSAHANAVAVRMEDAQ
ncbi:MAG TPA: histidinol dehydrogenase, partial [Candidatus Limiplasma sp.]|nr:histidinol dehydrogenase [Candidatus Limiplasma sp.]